MADEPVASRRGRWCPSRTASRSRVPRDGRHVDARARAARRGCRSTRSRASSRCSTPSASARCRSRSAAAGDGGSARPHDPRRRRRHRRALPQLAAGHVGVRGPFGNDVAARRTRAARTSSSSPAGSGSRRCGPRSAPARAGATRTAASACSTARARRTTCSTRASSSDWRADGLDVRRDRRRRRRPAGPAGSASSRSSSRRARSTGPTVALVCGPEVMMRFTRRARSLAPRRRRRSACTSRSSAA